MVGGCSLSSSTDAGHVTSSGVRTHHGRLVGQVAEVRLVPKEVRVWLNGLEVSLPQVEEPGEKAFFCVGDVVRREEKQGWVQRQNKSAKSAILRSSSGRRMHRPHHIQFSRAHT